MISPNAFTYIGDPSAFPAQIIATLLGVYPTSHQSLGRFHLSVFTSEVHVFKPYVSHETSNIWVIPVILFSVSESIFRKRERIPGLITSS